eukprot:CAMPEP_0113637648 /NCGR_PEP_ID=MMETSP0017_2-20120614/19713_1 /TAXON_ID=2856 /ORGANISM="Cylindrotheca closterium" /LENGTH=752 /DNA_ID=CAMNT_0000548699 /DNA_START=205 /DNA_END=2463 /DNA_ORIENTATION=+ /assembly_acc=CAM_ASM_000147
MTRTTPHLLPITTVLTATLCLQSFPSVAGQTTPVYSGCEADAYYGSLSDNPSRQEISNLLKSTHRNVLPYTSSREDTWDALMDLDPGTQSGTVSLIYSDHEAQGEAPSGQSRAWNREHLWPKSHGVGYTGADFTDVHHLRPADVNVNSARGNKYFAACGIVEPLDTCRSPAHSEASASTTTDNEVWLPPTEVRGDIARALFYMELRYSGVGGDPNLELTDCPTEVSDNKLAYLSQLMEWHQEDPVDEEERNRNGRVCERWQGNRNIFVDFPDLVGRLYGESAQPNQSNGYECSLGENTPPPTPTSPPLDSTDSTCGALVAGDIQVIAVHSDNPDEVALVTLVDLTAGLEIYLTDSGWAGTEFRDSEGTAKLTVPQGGISAGTIFGFGDEGSNLLLATTWAETGALSLSTQGDSLIVYCQPSEGKYNFLGAATTNNVWDPNQSDSNNSGLPAGLESTSIALPHFDNYIYIGPSEGKKSDIVEAIAKEEHWSGFDNTQPLKFEFSFVIASEAVTDCQDLKAGDVQIIGVHSDNPDEIALVALQDLPANLELYLTDDAWTGNGFRGSEGTVKLIVPDSGITKGSFFGFGDETSLPYASSWSQVSGSLALSTQGDALAVYCKPTESTFNFLAALSLSGSWVSSGFSSTNGALPPGLEQANTALSHRDNYQYVGPTSGSRNELISAIGDEANWKGSNSAESVVYDTTFTVIGGGSSSGGGGSGITPSGVNPDDDDESASVTARISIGCLLFALFMLV